MELTQLSNYNEKPNNYNTLIPSYNGVLLTEKNLEKVFTLEDKEKIAVLLFDYFRKFGFPYPEHSKSELMKDWMELKNYNALDCLKGEDKDIIVDFSKKGITLFKHFSPHFFEVSSNSKIGMVEAFNNDINLMNTIKNRLEINFNICGRMLRQGLRNSYNCFAASIFKALFAKLFYELYAPENGIVYDPCLGFSQRLLGTLSSSKNLTYIACDPWDKAIDGAMNILRFLGEEYQERAIIHQIGAEDFCPEQYKEKIDLVFSSIPYFDVEVYSKDQSQAYSNRSYQDFINIWWKKVVSNLAYLVKPGGIVGINVMQKYKKNNFGEDIVRVMKEGGFSEVKVLNIKLSKNIAFRSLKDIKYEPIFVMKRG